MACVSPPIILTEDVSPVVSVQLSLDKKKRWLDGSLEFEYDPTVLLKTLSPTRGPSSGGTTVTIEGTNFRAHRVYHVSLMEERWRRRLYLQSQ